MKKITIYLYSFLFILFTDSVLAKNIGEVVKAFTDTFIVGITKLMLSLAFLFFFWNIFRMVFTVPDDDYKKYKTRMWWSILILFVLFSFWGIIHLMQESVKLDNTKNSIQIHLQ